MKHHIDTYKLWECMIQRMICDRLKRKHLFYEHGIHRAVIDRLKEGYSPNGHTLLNIMLWLKMDLREFMKK